MQPNQKITADKLPEMIKDFQDGLISQTNIGRKYGICRARVNQYYNKFLADGLVQKYDRKKYIQYKPLLLEKTTDTTQQIYNKLIQMGHQVELVRSTKSTALMQYLKVNGKTCFVVREAARKFYPAKGSIRGYYRCRVPGFRVKKKKHFDFFFFITPRGTFVIPDGLLDCSHIYIQENGDSTLSTKVNREYVNNDKFASFREAWFLLKG